MVGRVSSYSQQDSLINSLLRNQQRMFEDQRQITSRKQFDDYAGMGSDTTTVLGSKSFLSRTETYQDTVRDIRGRLDANDTQLEAILTNSREMHETMLGGLANNRAEGIEELLGEAFRFISAALNTNIGGNYIFSGSNTGTKPVNVQSIEDLAALSTVADAFDNSNVAFKARINDEVELDFGLLANEVGEDIFQSLLNIHNYINGSGAPFSGELTQAQYDFIQAELATLDTAIDGVQGAQASNGLAYSRLEVVDQQHRDTAVFLETFVSDIEDVNIAEAISNLNRNQLALEVSYQAIGSISELSLLRFI